MKNNGRAFIKELSENPKPSDWIEAEQESGAGAVFPSFACFGMEQNRFHRYDVYHHLIYTCDAPLKDLQSGYRHCFMISARRLPEKVRGRILLSTTTKFGNGNCLPGFKPLGNAFRAGEKVTLLVRYHVSLSRIGWTDSAVRRILKNRRENLEDLLLSGRRPEGNDSARRTFKVKDFRGRIDELLKEEAGLKSPT